MSTIRRIAKNTGFVFFGNNALKILSIILIFLIARYLGDAEYGKLSFVLSFTGLFFILTDLGTRILVVREIAQDKKKSPKVVSTILTLKAMTSFFVFFLILLAAFLLNYEKELILGIGIAAIGMIFDSFSTTLNSIFQAYERMEFPTITKIAKILIRFLITVPLLLSGIDFISVLAIFVFVQFLNLLFSLIFCFKLFVKPIFVFDRDYMMSLVKRSFPFLLSGIFVTVYFRIDVTLMSKLAPTALPGIYSETTREAVIGWYSSAYNILDGMISIAGALSAAMLPVAISYYKTSKKNLIRLYRLSVRYLTYLSIPAAVGIYILAEKIIILIYGYEYVNAVFALRILIWTIIPLYVNYVLGAMTIAMHKEKQTVYVLFGNCLVNLGLNIVLIPKLSLVGAALATVLTEIFYFGGYYYIVSKNLTRLNLFNLLYKPVTASIMMAILLLRLKEFLNVFALVPIGFITYFLIMFLSKAFEKQDIELVKKIVKR
ncbi:oligosaccharide flippase family protein [Candidatus Woesearchaeota archaeon]|nr:oligosaccharide flippase family protein [Candidatus Woesearchaeota archaeon]